MNITLFFQSLKDSLNENDQKILIESAKQDNLLLNQIRNNDFFMQCVESFGNSLEKWSLGKVAMLSVDSKIDVVGKDVKEKYYLKNAISVLDETFKNHAKEIDFQRATYIALALFERKRKSQSWSGLLEELSNGFSRKSTLSTWRTSLAILYSLIDFDDDLLQALITDKDPYIGVSFVNHILATQFIPQKEKAFRLVRLLEKQSLETQIIWVQTLPGQVSYLANQISIILGESKIFSNRISESHFNQNLDFVSKFEPIFKMNLLNGFRYQLEKSPLQAKSNFLYAKDRLQKILRLIDLNIIPQSYDEVQNDLMGYMNEPKFNDLAFNQIVEGNKSLNSANTDFHNKGIFANLTYACEIQKNGEELKAREIGERQFKNWLNAQKVDWPSSETVSYLQNIDHKRIILLLNTLGLNGLSAEYIKFLSDISFSMDEMQDELIQAYQSLNLIDEAYSELKLCLNIGKNQEEVYKNIFDLLSKNNRWSALYSEWENYANSFTLSQEDWINYANVALNANQLEKTRFLLEKMKSEGVNRTQIDVISGKLYYLEGEYEKARAILEETTKRLPEYEEGWIVLSDVYNEMGLFQKTMETLRTAVLAIPNSSIIHFNLAKTCIGQELYAEALPYIRKAVGLDPDNSFYNLNLIHTLQTLGRTDEADLILSQGRQKWPFDREIAFVDAIRQVEKQNRAAALAAFEVAINLEDEKTPINKLLLFVQTMLGDRPEKFLPTDGKFNQVSNLLNAQKILQKAINDGSDDTVYLQLVLGEVYYLTGEAEAANSIYSKLVNEFKSNQIHQSLLWRVYAGLGLVKVDLSEVDSGIAALQEADQLNPKHLGIKQKIAETYLSASLTNQAEAKAEEIYQLGSTDIENLLWYSNFMVKIGNSAGEIRGLEQILHFDSVNSTAITRLANIYITQGDLDRAIEVLEKLKGAENLDNYDIRNAVVSYLRIGKYQEALEWFNKIVDNQNGVDAKKRVIEKIFLLMANQNWDSALAEIQNLKRNNSNSRILSSLEGECLYNKTDYSAAIYAFDAALSFPIDDKNSVQEYLKNDSLIPANWLEKKNKDFPILQFLTNSHKKKLEYDQCLEMIDRMIKINPEEPWLYLMGAEFSLQLTDYDLASNYLLRYKNTTTTENVELDTDLFATALDYAGAFLDDREYRLSFKDDGSKSELRKVLKAHYLLDKNLFDDANQLFNETEVSTEKILVKNPDDPYSDIKSSIHRRLVLLLVWRLNNYPNVEKLLEQFDKDNIEKAFLTLAIGFAYQTMLDIFEKNEVQSHRSSVIENEIADSQSINHLLTIINRYGKTKAIKNIESLNKVIIEKDYSTAFSLINSKTLPKYMNFVLVNSLMKAGKSEMINEYISNFKSESYENLFFLINNQTMNKEEKIAFVEAQLQTDDPVWLSECSRIYEKNGNLNEAIELAEQAHKIWPDEEKWLIRIAKLYQQSGDFESADQYWKNILKHTKEPKSVIYQYIDLLLENKKAVEVIQLLDEYKGKITESYEFHTSFAKAYLLMKSHEKSKISIQAARKFAPVSIDLDYLEAESFYLNNEDEKSKTKIFEILQNNPKYEQAYILHSVILKEAGKSTEAIQIINNGLEKCPDSKGLQMEKIKNLNATGDVSNGLMLASELSQRFPNDIEVLKILANIYHDIEDYQAAEVVARKSLHLQSNQPDIHLLLGKVAKHQGQLDQALNHFSKAAMSIAEGVEPWLEIGDIYLDQQETEKALESYREAYSRNDKDYRAFYKTGLLLRDLKDYQGAEKMLKIASSLSPKDTSIRRQLAGVVALNLVHSS
ncbi:MAG: tetratricopeptide repeat protein [Anaerolineaceae bacterium]|nr:tetratricopeptide repeat protein [Anaerolineaceae bacterium]